MTDGPAQQLDDLFSAGDTVMLMTMIGDTHSSRPMTVAGIEGPRLSFLVDSSTDWFAPVADGRAVVHVTLSDVRHNTFAAVNGDARVTSDPGEIALLWNPAAAAFFDGENDPTIAVIHVTATDGQYWDAPSGRLGTLFALAKAKVTGDDEAAGDHGSIAT